MDVKAIQYGDDNRCKACDASVVQAQWPFQQHIIEFNLGAIALSAGRLVFCHDRSSSTFPTVVPGAFYTHECASLGFNGASDSG
jgi:hypothetical protein